MLLLFIWMTMVSFQTGLTSADSISPVQQEVSGREGQPVTLTCHYQTDDDYPVLYWYKHHSDLQAPKFILYKGAKSNSGKLIPDAGYGSETSATSTTLRILKVTLADTALYYCALEIWCIYLQRWVAGYNGMGFIFGDPIQLTVHPDDVSALAPTLFILSPATPPNHQPVPGNQPGLDVCLAADFRPKEGVMVLNEDAASTSQSTSRAVLSIKQKTYFYTGFSQQGIQSCRLQDSFISRTEETRTYETRTYETRTYETRTYETRTEETRTNETRTNETHRIMSAKLNFHLLLFNGLRVIFTKAVTFSTILTFRALMT